MVVTVLSVAVVASFALGYMLGRRRSTPRPPGRHSVAYFEMASATTIELPVVTDRAKQRRARPVGGPESSPERLARAHSGRMVANVRRSAGL